MKQKWIYHIVFIIITLAIMICGQAFAGADDLAKQADKIIRNAERKMFSGQNQEAETLLIEAAALLDQGRSQDAANPKLQRAEKKLIRIQKKVARKLGNKAKKASSSRPALPPKPKVKAISKAAPKASPASNASSTAKLPGGVKKRLRDIGGHLKKAQGYVDRDAAKAENKLKQARKLFADIEKQYSGQYDPSHPDFVAVQTQYEALAVRVAEQEKVQAKVRADAETARADEKAAQANARAEAQAAKEKKKEAAAAVKAAAEKQSQEWIVKFQAYLSYRGIEGHNPEMLVFVPGTSEPEKFADAQKRYEAFKAFYETYKKAQFPNGKTWKLEDLADKQAPMRIKDFEEGFASRVSDVAGYAEKEIDAAMNYLNKDNGWKSDKTVKPNLVDRNRMTSIKKAAQKVMDALEKSDSKRKQIMAKLDALVAKDRGNRQIRKERTFMIPDRYSGGDIGKLKKKAASLVKENKKEGGKPLRTTLISPDWTEETVKEWTDTSKTTWRIRTTRRLTAQVAAKTATGVRLITVALAQDKKSNGKWGALYGNLHQYSDPMLKANINK